MSKQFVDTNLLMEIMFARPKLEKISKVLRAPEHEFFISALTVHILYYFAEAEGIDRNFVRKLADLGFHLPLSRKAVSLAQARYSGKDFEDCLQASSAELGGCDEILTLDKNFAGSSGTKLPVRII